MNVRPTISTMAAASRAFPMAWRRHTCRAMLRHSGVCSILKMEARGYGERSRLFHVHAALMPPAIFAGLFVTLWCWKCTMLVLFQNMIIYNPYLPPNARGLRISEYSRQCGGIEWREKTMRSLDGTQLSLCVSDIETSSACQNSRTPVYVLYMQGTHDLGGNSIRMIVNMLRKCIIFAPQATGSVMDSPQS